MDNVYLTKETRGREKKKTESSGVSLDGIFGDLEGPLTIQQHLEQQGILVIMSYA